MAVESPAFANQNSTYGAEQTRRAIASLLLRGASVGSIWGGIVGAGDCVITAGSGMQISVAPGEAWVPGSTSASQSGYYGRVSSATTLSIAASDPSNPRVDRVVALITDSAYSGGTNTFAISVTTGTPTAGATLANHVGAGAVPASSLILGYVLVPAGSSSVTGGNIANVATLVPRGQDSGWVTFTLGTGWSAGGSGYAPAYRVMNNMVMLSGFLNAGASVTNTIATLPSAVFPADFVAMGGASAHSGAWAGAMYSVTTAGVLAVSTGAGASIVSGDVAYLDNLAYRLI